MHDVDHFFKSMRSSGDMAVREAQRQACFEERMIRKLLTYAGETSPISHLKHSADEQFGSTDLTFPWFEANYPAFPVRIGSAKLRRTSGTHIGWVQLDGAGFMKQPWVKEYKSLALQLNVSVKEERLAMVFNAPHADGGAVQVFHNQPIQAGNTVVDPERREESYTRHIRPYGYPRVTYVLECFDSFMETVGREWLNGVTT